MNLTQYTQLVANGLFIKPEVDPVAHCALGLAGEAGEVADLVKKAQYVGRTFNPTAAIEELGDAFWYLTQLTHLLGLTLEQLAYYNIEKLHARHPTRYPDPSTLPCACEACNASIDVTGIKCSDCAAG